MALISRRVGYGLRTVCRLAERASRRDPVTIAWLAQNERLPRKYLEQILRALKQANLVDSRPGPHGGCRLARPAEEITVGDVVRALDGELRAGHCLEPGHSDDLGDCPGCWGLETCALREVWLRLGAAIGEVLDNVTIASLVARQQELTPQMAEDYQI